VPSGQGQFEPHALAALREHKRGTQRSAILNRLGAKVRRIRDPVRQDTARSLRRKGRDQRIVTVQHRNRFASIESFDQLAFRQGNFFHGREKFQVRWSYARDHANVRPRNLRKPRKLAPPRHPHFQHRRLMCFVQVKQRQRQAVLVVEIAFRLQDAKPRAQQCRQDLFGSGLADTARDPGNFPAPRFANGTREPFERDERVGHDQAPTVHDVGIAPKLRFGNHRRERSALQRIRHVIVSVMTQSVYGDEQFSSTYRARINRDTGHPGHGVESCARPSTHRASHLCNRPPHNRLKGFPLRKYHTGRSVFTILRAPPD